MSDGRDRCVDKDHPRHCIYTVLYLDPPCCIRDPSPIPWLLLTMSFAALAPQNGSTACCSKVAMSASEAACRVVLSACWWQQGLRRLPCAQPEGMSNILLL